MLSKLLQLEHNERMMRLKDIQSYSRLENLERTASMSKDETFTGLHISVGDYRDVTIKSNSVIYCDIPYKKTREYRHNKDMFDYDSFYDWCERQTSLVVISEYWMPEDRFVCIAEVERRSTFSASNNTLQRIEKLFVPKHQYDLYKTMMNKSKSNNKQLNLFDKNENYD